MSMLWVKGYILQAMIKQLEYCKVTYFIDYQYFTGQKINDK